MDAATPEHAGRARRVFVTGDTHGSNDILKLTGKYWPEGGNLGRDDLLVICGDFGLVWSEPASEESGFWLDWLEARPWTTLFVDGNHENHDLLDGYAVSEWCGGRVHVLPGHPHVIHLMRGQAYDVDVHGRWFVLGGARSQDRQWRVEGRTWWRREMPSDEEYDEASRALADMGFAPDYVFTHDCPTDRLTYAMPWYVQYRGTMPPADQLTSYLQYVDERLDGRSLRAWYCGHYHDDLRLGDDRHHLLYRQVVELGEGPVENPHASQFVPGAGVAIPEEDVGLAEVAEREHASMSELESYLAERKEKAGLVAGDRMDADGQRAFRLWVDARRRRELRAAGPAADIV